MALRVKLHKGTLGGFNPFYDENAIQFYDPDHSDDEDRFILLGLSLKPQVLVVCHCFRESEEIIRIISARKADKDEALEYWEQIN